MGDLLQRVAAALDRGDAPDSKWPDAEGEYWGLCPFHADSHSGSFSVSAAGYRCFSCGAAGGLRSLAAHLNVLAPQSADLGEGLTLEAYADAKRLPPGYLLKLGINQVRERGRPLLHIPYYGLDGQIVAIRKRLALHKSDGIDNRFRWQRGAKLTLYGLWRLAEMRQSGWMLLVEGESDCHTAWLHELPALGVPGANNWRSEWAEHLNGLQVYVWREPDQGGCAFIERISCDLPRARVIVPPAEIKDLSAAYLAGQKLGPWLDELKAQAQPIGELAAPVEPIHCTDMGNAQRLAARYGAELRYCYGLARWYVWDGRRWAPDDNGVVQRYAKDTATAIKLEVQGEENVERRQELAAWARRSENETRLRAMVNVACSEPGIPVLASELDTDPWMLNCLNGTLDLRTGELRAHSQDDLITKLAPVRYDPEARSDVWECFLDEATSGDQELQGFLARAIGYSLTGFTTEEKLFFIHGPGGAGKSTFVEAIKSTLGDYAMTADFETFLARSFTGGMRNDIARLAGARFVASIEVEEGKRLAEGLVKTITGGDTVTARFLYREAFSFKPNFTLWLCANHAPEVKDNDSAMWRRILRVPFEHMIPAERRDPAVKQTLCDPEQAGSAILAWAIRGCLEWQRVGLAVPESVTAATEAYRREMDPLSDFIAACCLLAPTAHVPSAELRQAYEDWTRENGATAMGAREWVERVKALGCKPSVRLRIMGKLIRCWVGIGLRSETDAEFIDALDQTAKEQGYLPMDKPQAELDGEEDDDVERLPF